jgi:nucleoside-diphosphate-sugar epimerase
MKILVTGGAGSTGTHYVRTLRNDRRSYVEDLRVTVLDDPTFPRPAPPRSAGIEPVTGLRKAS